MFKVNDNYQKLPGSYLFSTIAKKVSAYQAANPEKTLIRLGIGDVTQPLAPAIIDAMHGAVTEMGNAETFHGYAPDLGYEFLRTAIADNDYKARGCDISADEIFVSDGAKSDSGNIQEIFSVDNRIAVCDPVYPVYVDSNVMAGGAMSSICHAQKRTISFRSSRRKIRTSFICVCQIIRQVLPSQKTSCRSGLTMPTGSVQ